MADPRHQFGLDGEQLAEQFLRKLGLKTVARRFATPVGELDLVMREGKTIVFAEVKTRRDRDLADPQDAVTPAKQRRIVKAARWFLHARGLEDRPCRFDVVAILLAPPAAAEVVHFPDAFAPDA